MEDKKNSRLHRHTVDLSFQFVTKNGTERDVISVKIAVQCQVYLLVDSPPHRKGERKCFRPLVIPTVSPLESKQRRRKAGFSGFDLNL